MKRRPTVARFHVGLVTTEVEGQLAPQHHFERMLNLAAGNQFPYSDTHPLDMLEALFASL